MPLGSKALFFSVVFCCFAPIGFVGDITTLGGLSLTMALLLGALSGVSAMVYAAAAMYAPRRVLAFIVAGCAIAQVVIVERLPQATLPAALGTTDIVTAHDSLDILMTATIAMTVMAYAAFTMLFALEGQRYFGLQREIRLARSIHAGLVPPVSGHTPTVEWYGASHPSGEVGGDLVDVTCDVAGWNGCVADVSGHGVAAGVVMGMFKTAVRAAMADGRDCGELVTRVNAVLAPLREPNMFVTAAVLRYRSDDSIEYVLAGHPPLLLWREATGEVIQVGESQLAIGFGANTRYFVNTFKPEAGDIVVAVTDGMLEVADTAEQELGMTGLADVLKACDRSAPVEVIAEVLFEACRRYGRQTDDQTALIIRAARHETSNS